MNEQMCNMLSRKLGICREKNRRKFNDLNLEVIIIVKHMWKINGIWLRKNNIRLKEINVNYSLRTMTRRGTKCVKN